MKIKLFKQFMFASKQMFYIFLLQLFTLQLVSAGQTRSQNIKQVRISVDLEEAGLEKIFSTIEGKTNFVFIYDAGILMKNQTRSLTFKNEPVAEVLKEVANEFNLNFRQINNTIFVKENELTGSSGENSKEQAGRPISGKVTDQNGEPLPGVSVFIKKTSTGTVTATDGTYQLNVDPDDRTLVFSFVGMENLEIEIDGRAVISVTLEEKTIGLEEIVAIGYGTQQKKDLTSSVTSIKADDFVKGATGSNPLQLVEGKIAGLTVTRTNGNDPNAGLSIQLRGVSSVEGNQSPLIIIDGVPGGDLNTLSTQDIASIDVLKDGSAAAIYGTRGTNGVILVTTKKGESGTTKVEFETQIFTEFVQKRLKSLSADQYWNFSVERQKPVIDLGYSTNWFDEMIKTPVSQMYNLSLSGGTDKITYRASLGYKNQEGIVVASTNRQTLNGRISLSQKNWDGKLKFDLNLAYSNIDADYTNYAAFEQTVVRNPTWPVYNPDGTFYYAANSSELDYNPVASVKNSQNGAEFNKFLGDFRATLEIIPGLKASGMIALSKNTDITHNFEPSTSETNTSAQIKGQAERRSDNSTDHTLEVTIDYSKNIQKHSFAMMAGYSYQDFMSEYFRAKNMDFASDQFTWNNLEAGTYLKEGKATMSSGKGDNTLIALFGRAIYNYDNRYLFTATLRREGSSRFGNNNKWGTFPAVSLGWRLNNESFMKHMEWLSDLKIRAGYGETGNQMSANYVSIPRINSQQYVLNGDEWILTYGSSSNPNADLKWEEKHEINIGFDFGALSSRAGMTFDWYKRKNKDLLYVVQASVPSLIYSNIWANVGDMESTGIELTVYGEPIRTKNLNLSLSANISHNKSRLISLSNSKYVSAAKYLEFGYLGAPGILGNTIRLEEGGKVGNFYGFHYQGLSDNGKWIFEDLNTDEKVSEELDEKVIGNGVPKYFLGFTANLRYKQVDLALSLRGAFGFDILNTKEIYYGNPYTFPSNNLLLSALDKHKNLNDIPQYSDYYLEKGDYLKISNLSVGYNFNTGALGKYINRLRLFVSADNLHTFTSYSGIDPEINSTGFETGIDYRGFYPRTCMLTFGLNVTL